MTDEEKAALEAKEKADKEAAEKAKTQATGLSEEEVNKRIEAARKQEKDKLYSQITDLKAAVDTLSAQATSEQEAKKKAELEVATKKEADRQAKLSTDDRLAEQMKRFEEQLAKEAAERERLQSELAAEREQAELERYRQQILSGETDIIPDLVRGMSKSDIDRSVAFAKTRYQELFQATKAKAEGQVTNNMPGPTNPNPAALDEAELQKSIANFQIDTKRYHRDPKYRDEMDAKRQAVLTQVGSAYQKAHSG